MPRRAPPALATVAAVAALVAFVASPAPARAADDWNQWNEPAVSGVARGATKLSLGVDWAHVPGGHSLRLGGDVEHLLRDRWGLTARAAVPIDGAWIAPALLGVRFHFVPRSPLDAYLGASGGVAWMRPDLGEARVDPMVSGEAGVALYYWAFFFLEAGARYDLVRYAAPSGAADLSGVAIGGRTGVYF